jgi:hypothetical protein
MQEYMNKLTTGEKAFAGGTLLLLIDALIFDWFKYESGSELFDVSVSYGAFDYPGGTWVTLAVILSVALTGLLLAIKFGGMNAPNISASLTWGMIYGAGAALTVLFILLKFWRIMAAPAGGFDIIGFLLAVIAAAAIGYGGYLLYQSDKGAGYQSLMNRKSP